MARNNVCTDLLGIQGWQIGEEGIRIDQEDVIVPLHRKAGTGYVCSGCS